MRIRTASIRQRHLGGHKKHEPGYDDPSSFHSTGEPRSHGLPIWDFFDSGILGHFNAASVPAFGDDLDRHVRQVRRKLGRNTGSLDVSAGGHRGDPSVVRLKSELTSGEHIIAVFEARSPGSTFVTARFEVSCSSLETSPCTIPPEGEINFGVTVVSP